MSAAAAAAAAGIFSGWSKSSSSGSSSGSNGSSNGNSNTNIKGLSASDEVQLTNRIRSLEKQLSSLESDNRHLAGTVHSLTSQLSTLASENAAMVGAMTANGSNASKHDVVEKNLVLALEREAAAKKENSALQEQYKFAELNRQEMQSRLLDEIAMKENKQRQLIDTIKLTQR